MTYGRTDEQCRANHVYPLIIRLNQGIKNQFIFEEGYGWVGQLPKNLPTHEKSKDKSEIGGISSCQRKKIERTDIAQHHPPSEIKKSVPYDLINDHATLESFCTCSCLYKKESCSVRRLHAKGYQKATNG